VFLKDLHQPGEIELRPAEAVNLIYDDIYDDAIDALGLNVGKEPLEGRSGEIGAGEAKVKICQAVENAGYYGRSI
jgi:hypothetical protein